MCGNFGLLQLLQAAAAQAEGAPLSEQRTQAVLNILEQMCSGERLRVHSWRALGQHSATRSCAIACSLLHGFNGVAVAAATQGATQGATHAELARASICAAIKCALTRGHECSVRKSPTQAFAPWPLSC